jgi:hypothetical protein
MKLFILIFFYIATIGCKTEIKNPNNIKENIAQKTKQTEKGNVFFDFDEVDFYNIDFDEGRSIELIRNREKSNVDKLKYEIILGETPENIGDTAFVKQIKDIGFVYKKIENDKFKSINKVFVEKNISDDYAFACAPVYRDILIFKKKGEIIGIAKICFSCQQNIIIGTKANTINFGHNGDYGRLRRILYH